MAKRSPTIFKNMSTCQLSHELKRAEPCTLASRVDPTLVGHSEERMASHRVQLFPRAEDVPPCQPLRQVVSRYWLMVRCRSLWGASPVLRFQLLVVILQLAVMSVKQSCKVQSSSGEQVVGPEGRTESE